MSFGGIGLALTAVQAVSQLGQGKAQQAESNYNATLLDGKAKLIDEQKQIESGQYNRFKGKTMGTSFANIAKMGIQPTGSAMAVMLDAQTQIGIDQAIGQFNLEQDKLYAQAEASQARRQGKQAVSTSRYNAFSTLLSGAYQYKKYTTAGTRKDTTFDSRLPYRNEGVLG